MSGGKNQTGRWLSRHFDCPACGNRVTVPLLWITGVEIVFRCRKCRSAFSTGYKAGALLFATAFVLAVATVNVLCYITGSGTLMVMFFAAFPLWLFYGFLFRKAWMLHRCRKK